MASGKVPISTIHKQFSQKWCTMELTGHVLRTRVQAVKVISPSIIASPALTKAIPSVSGWRRVTSWIARPTQGDRQAHTHTASLQLPYTSLSEMWEDSGTAGKNLHEHENYKLTLWLGGLSDYI